MQKSFHEAATAILRNRFLSAVTIISIAFILLIFNILFAVNQIANQTINGLSEQVTLQVYLKKNISETKLEPVLNELKKLNYLTQIDYQSSTESLKKLAKKYPDSIEFLSKYDLKNPLPAVVILGTKSLEDHQKLLKTLEAEPFNDYFRFDDNTSQKSTIKTVVNNLIKIKSFTFQLILWVMLTFSLGGSLMIFNALNITLFNRRKEIQIMQFVGATHQTIKKPFVIEGVLYGLFAFFLNIVVLIAVSGFLPSDLQNFRQIIADPAYQIALVLELIMICLISGYTSLYTINNYLKNRTIIND